MALVKGLAHDIGAEVKAGAKAIKALVLNGCGIAIVAGCAVWGEHTAALARGVVTCPDDVAL